MKSINPATEEMIAEYPEHSLAQVEMLLGQAAEAYVKWGRQEFDERSHLMRRAAQTLRKRSVELSLDMVREMGKPFVQAEAEIEKCAVCCDWFAENAERLLRPEPHESDASRSYVRFDPLGPVLAIMPWNFPYWQVFRFAAPALMAGNVGILKHAWNVPGCGVEIENVFAEAGFPPGTFTNLLIGNDETEKLIGHPKIAAVTLTGSERAGKAVAAAAGRAIKKCVLELGGSDPFIVLADVDVPKVAKAAAEARCINSGQSCIAAKRFIVLDAIADAFTREMRNAMQSMRIGDPFDRDTQIGPLARADLRDALDDQVRKSLDQGAQLECGGKRWGNKGYFYEPTLLSNVRPGMTAFEEETFGPVAAVIRADNESHAITLANQSKYGLGASIWTRDTKKAESLAAEMESGCVFINGIVKSDPRLPFGGTKLSGYGRELSEAGIREFVNIKTVWVKEEEAGDGEKVE